MFRILIFVLMIVSLSFICSRIYIREETHPISKMNRFALNYKLNKQSMVVSHKSEFQKFYEDCITHVGN
jgi:hypothetical protein